MFSPHTQNGKYIQFLFVNTTMKTGTTSHTGNLILRGCLLLWLQGLCNQSDSPKFNSCSTNFMIHHLGQVTEPLRLGAFSSDRWESQYLFFRGLCEISGKEHKWVKPWITSALMVTQWEQGFLNNCSGSRLGLGFNCLISGCVGEAEITLYFGNSAD